jgi:hypothetical protein
MPSFVKHDKNKVDFTILPWDSLREVVRVMEFGALLYGMNNWRSCTDYKVWLRAALRHIVAILEGEEKDKESGYLHLAHASCNLLYAISTFLRISSKDVNSQEEDDLERTKK